MTRPLRPSQAWRFAPLLLLLPGYAWRSHCPSKVSPHLGSKAVGISGRARRGVITTNAMMAADDEISEYMGKVIQALPNNVINAYKVIAEKITIRLSLLSLAIHVMILLPFLNSYKKILLAINLALAAADSSADSNSVVSVVPFLYISPLIILLPFLYFYLWENNSDLYYKIPSNLFDSKLREFIVAQKTYATDKLREEGASILGTIYNSDNNNNNSSSNNSGTNGYNNNDDDIEYKTKMAKTFAYLQVLSRVDVDILFNECVNAKIYQKRGVVTNNKSYNNKIFSSFNDRSSGGSSNVDDIDDLLNSEIISGSKLQLSNAFSLIDATEEIMKRSNTTDKQQLIRQLKDFQVALNEGDTNNVDNNNNKGDKVDEYVLKLGIQLLSYVQRMLK